MNRFLKELVLWVLILLPIVYLAAIWNNLPEIVPTHFNGSGVANGWSHKSTLIYLTAGLGIGFYLIMLAIPFIDPRKNIVKMGHKYYNIRLILSFFIALILAFLIYSSNGKGFKNPNIHLLILGTIFALLGVLCRTIKPNHFIGFRTPWTMESDLCWKKTHDLAAPILIWGGIIIDAFPFIFPHVAVMTYVVVGMILIMMLIPTVYSYFEFKREEKLGEID